MSDDLMTSAWTDTDSARAKQIWDDYQRLHDVSQHQGEAVGIDPATGQVWFGKTALEIWKQMETAGHVVPLFYLRVGQDYYVRKGGRR